MVPPAPPTFSMTTGWPSDTLMRSATTRARMSEPPPAGNGTIMVTGFDGKLCARAPTMPASTAHTITTISLVILRLRDFARETNLLRLHVCGFIRRLDHRRPLVD